jgi:hypothetical protein
MSNFAVERFALRDQASHFFGRGQSGQRRPAGGSRRITFEPARKCCRVAAQPDTLSGLSKQLPILRPQHDAAAASDHVPFEPRQVAEQIGFTAPKAPLTFGGENVGDGPVGLGFECIVGVDECPSELFGEQPADGRFAAAAGAYQENPIIRRHGS